MRAYGMGRRRFLRGALGMALGPAAASLGTGVLGALGSAAARAAPTDYKALVCVYLSGGNDSFNWLVPRDSAGYGTYAEARSTLAIARSSLLPVQSASGLDLGLHPSCAGTQSLFQSGEAAFVANCGVLMQPTTKDDYAAYRNLPPQLFSHSDQQDHWMSARPGLPKKSGWAGRLFATIPDANGDSRLSMNLSLAGTNLAQSGGPLPAYILDQGGAALIDDIHGTSANYYPYMQGLDEAQASINPLERSLALGMRNAFEIGELVDDALAVTAPPTGAFDEDTDVGSGLRMTAHMIAAHAALGVHRQIFVVAMGGFDTHDSQSSVHPALLGRLDAAVSTFQAEMRALGLADAVTLFTTSEFGRTVTANGDGTDHGWGAHQLVVGGAVRGGTVYGAMPDLTVDGPDDAGFGRIIPTQSTEQYLGTLARWFVPAGTSLTRAFPNLPNFSPRSLGFMA